MSDEDVSVLDSCISLLMSRGEFSAAGEVAAAGYRLLRADRKLREATA
jgi:hypothetical protein